MMEDAKILVVEDTLDSLKLLSDLLSAEGYRVLPANSGELALAAVAANPPDLVLLDIRMPGMDGFEVLRRLKADSASRDIPAIILSGITDAEDRVTGLKLGAVDFISKPFQQDELLAKVRIHVELVQTRRVARAARQETEDRYRLLFDTSTDGILLGAADGRVLEANRAACKILGRSEEEICALGCGGLVDPSDTRLAKAVEERQRTGRYSGELNLLRRDGTVFPAEISSVMFTDASSDSKTSIIFRDVAQRKASEAELQRHRSHLEELVLARTRELAQAKDAAEAASRAKSVFLANMSHELRTPMNGIMGMTDLALRRATDPKQIDWLKKSQGSAQHLLEVINDILDISKIEADRLTLEEQNFSPAEAIDDVLQMQAAQAAAKGLGLSAKIAPVLPAVLCGDALRVRQILLNYTGNAIKFSERGQITVRASLVEEDTSSVLLRLEVSDEGIGIGAEEQKKLFHAFTQADNSMTRKYGGTGLGLIISQRLARLMAGDAGVISAEGQGSTFWVTLRLRRAMAVPAAESAPAVPVREALARDFPGVRVLVAEDEPINREVMVFLLEDAGLAPETAGDGQEAVDKAREGGYGLILMDVQMPVMNGLEATRAIRQLPGMADIPILALTANAFDDDRNACLAAGMNDHISKPVTPDGLCEVVLHWLRQAGRGRASATNR